VGKDLLAVWEAQLLHQRRRHWSLGDGDWTGRSTQREGEARGEDVWAMLQIEGRLSLELRRLTRAENESISAEIQTRRGLRWATPEAWQSLLKPSDMTCLPDAALSLFIPLHSSTRQIRALVPVSDRGIPCN
jgi:hypothetical protein